MMIRARWLVLPVLAAAAVGGAAYWYLYERPGVAEGAPAAGPPGGFAVPVEAARVELASIRREVMAVGTLQSNEAVMLRPEITGRVAKLHFTEGREVAKGDLLVSLDSSVHMAELAEAEANLKLSERNYRRAGDLLAKGAGTERAKDEALAKFEVDKASVALARAKLDKTLLRAPFEGVLGLKRVSVGDYVNPGQDLVNLEDIDPIKVDFRVPEMYVGDLEVGQSVSMTVDAYSGETFAGEVFAIDPRLDREGRSLVVRAELPNPTGRLKPGLFARVALTVERHDDAILVPEEAVVPRDGASFVYRVEGDTAVMIKVSLGLRRAGKVEIVDGLGRDDVVITAGQLKVATGAKVLVAPAAGGD